MTALLAVHPRVCGELAALDRGSARINRFIPACAGNSPPRAGGARGKTRFIPACAGNSPRRPSQPNCKTVHPRVCGELGRATLAALRAAGSSPRVRGTPGGRLRRLSCKSVHPRVCGELAAAIEGRQWIGGSSPRVRGTRIQNVPLSRPYRFIPACAGNSAPGAGASCSHPVHPRVCGELTVSPSRTFGPSGSSPRVRGTRRPRDRRRGFVRFIPACAGNSNRASSARTIASGSSPRVRGTRAASARCPSCPPVHPRVCGELADAAGGDGGLVGSSPRVRGTR